LSGTPTGLPGPSTGSVDIRACYGQTGVCSFVPFRLESSPLPDGVTFINFSSVSDKVGLGTLHGTPAPGTAGQIYPLMVSATNSQGGATQHTILKVLRAGDVNHDDAVNCSDISVVKAALNAKRGNVKYNADADINDDGIVNVIDLAFVTSKLPAGTKCQ
jgi:Dockerin type I domain